MSQKRYSDEYVIVYTNGRTVQGHRVILSTSKVNILIRAKVQGAFSTYRMLYLTAGTITKSSSASVCLCEMTTGIREATLYTPLLGEEAVDNIKISEDENVTPFRNAGVLSRMIFWWLEPILNKGKEKVFEENDLPKLDPVLALATGPLLLKAFLRVSQGKESFKYEGYALAAGLFLVKCLESLSERQWNFQTRLSGLQVRSMLSAAIYQRQLRVSNAAKAFHSPGQIPDKIHGSTRHKAKGYYRGSDKHESTEIVWLGDAL
ncbi:hypothetical protein AgCh_019248 [Apium graveolens]